LTTNDEKLALISYVGDLSSRPPDDVFLIENDKDYVAVCDKLVQSLIANTTVKVWVRTKNHFTWLRDFTEQINCPASFEEKTSKLVLAELWNITVPDWLNDTDILENKFLEIEVDSQYPTSFENRLLTCMLGNSFQADLLTTDRLVDVIKSLVSDEAKRDFEKYPILTRCLSSKCQQWVDQSKEEWVKGICEILPSNPNQVWHWLSLWSGLHSYPEQYIEFVLTPEQVHIVKRIPSKAVENLPLELKAAEQIESQIEAFFGEFGSKINSNTDFVKILDRTSGKLLQEYQHIVRILKSNQFSPTREDLRKVQEKFKTCPGLSETQLTTLIYLAKPDYPSLVDGEKELTAEDWITWMEKEYIPYRNWQSHSNIYDEKLERTVKAFSDWYVRNYPLVQQDPDLSLIHCLRDISNDKTKNEFVLILLVDCLPLNYFDLLDNALRNVGLSRHNLSHRFAALPTTTEYNKAALLSGDWLVQTERYEVIIKKRSSDDWGNAMTKYHSNLKSLSDMKLPDKSCITLLNYIDTDELLHSDVESKNTTYEEELTRLFKRLAESAHRLCQEWNGPIENFSVYVVTDHGACRILEEEKQTLDSEIVNKLFTNEKYRYAAVTEEQLDKIPENLWDIGYRFKQPFKAENITYFLPRGHNTIRQARSVKGHMHGGVTPEEVIVPISLYKPVKVARKLPSVRFLHLDTVKETGVAKFYIQRVVALEIEIHNPNTADINVLRASVISPTTDVKSCEVPRIAVGSTNILKMGCYFKKEALDKHSLEIEIVYEIAGEQHVLPITIESEFKSALSSGFSLKDL